MDILEIDSVTKTFGRKAAVHDFSLVVREGQFYGLLRLNGAWKTTIIRMIMNIIAPDSGKVYVMGEGTNEDARDEIGFLPEQRALPENDNPWCAHLSGEIKSMSRSLIPGAVEEWLRRVKLIDNIDTCDGLDYRTDIQGGNPDVRQAADIARTREVGQI